jgi:hypothetical protein
VTRKWTIQIDEAPKSLNAGGTGSRRHWTVAYREKRYWEKAFGALLLEAAVSKHMTHCRVWAHLSFRDRRRRDVENYRPAISKPLADVMVAGGWLVDDTAEWFTLEKLTIGHLPSLAPGIKARMTIVLEGDYSSRAAA